jgi:DNA-binding NarL/FixJ family response regulator
MVPPPITSVAVLEGSPITRIGVISLIQSREQFSLSFETSDATIARRLCVEQHPDLIILDLELQHGDGLELLRELAGLSPTSRALVLTGQEDSQSLQRAFRTGALGFMSKFDEPPEFFTAIEHVLIGRLFASRRIAHLMLQCVASGELRSVGEGIPNLSNRELQVFRLIGKGIGPKAIASELGLSVKTVEAHQGRIKSKLSIRTCAELQRRAMTWNRRSKS